jgi:hypothetical protein
MVVLAEVMGVARVPFQVAEADAHVVDERSGDGDGDADAKDGMRYGQWVEVAVAQKELTGDESPEQGDGSEDGVGQMSE